MDPLALALVLTAAGLHATWNLTLHGASDRIVAMGIAGLVGGVILSPGLVWDVPLSVWPLLLPSIAAQVSYGLALSAAYRRGALSFAYPVGRGSAPLLVTTGAWLGLGQVPSVPGVAGATALVVGLLVLARRAMGAGQLHAFGLAIATGCAIATYSVVDAAAVREVSPVGYLALVQLASGAVLLGLARSGRARLMSSLRQGALIGVGSTGAYLLVLLAFQRAAAGSVATLRELSVVLAVAVSGERPGLATWCGVVLCALGAVLAAA